MSRSGKCVFRSRNPIGLLRPRFAAALDVQIFEPLLEQMFVQSSHCQGSNPNFQTMRGGGAKVRVVLHVPQMTELMFRTGRRAT
jgi:hypothetical protein